MRKRRKKSEMPFAEALEFARKRLVKAQKEHEIATASLASLNAEIPSLMSTIDVLQKALEPSKIGQPIKWSVPPGDPLSFPSDSFQVTQPVVFGKEVLTEDDTLPEPEGTELLPE